MRWLPAPLARGVMLLIGSAGCALFSDVSTEDAHAMVANGALLVDVRSPEEFAEKHVGGAINVPVAELKSRLAELEPRDRPIVVYCHSGTRAYWARRTLLAEGFTNVHNLGPMAAW